jgi:hypothetical protein
VSIPFSFCRLPTGTTIDELVTSGRSVSIGLLGCVHSAAAAETIPARVPEKRAAKRSDRIDDVRAVCACVINQQLGPTARHRAGDVLFNSGSFAGALRKMVYFD